MEDLIEDRSPTTEKTKSEASSSNSVERSSAQDGQTYSEAHHRLTAKQKAAIDRSLASDAKRVAENATKKQKASIDISPERKKVAAAKDKKPRKTSKDADGKKGTVQSKSPEKKKAAAAKDKKPRKTSKNAGGKKETIQAKAAKSTKKRQSLVKLQNEWNVKVQN
ncbi:hypothetical protein AVEN_193090-1 [Araneus ventricosus]|uniref:Uncharacterized protein n=1 Tax=Araneus ventricosus TaxID=182803 RepID=A0A4Y2B0H5_ARAVE|nr:hypothetical protein AVEN_193090-1 [Araneus ventricosus]